MWRLVQHPDKSLCVGQIDIERATLVELHARRQPMREPLPTAHLWIWSGLELALGLWTHSVLMFFNCVTGIITNSFVQWGRYPQSIVAMVFHGMFMCSYIPFIAKMDLIPELVLIVSHCVIYVVHIVVTIL